MALKTRERTTSQGNAQNTISAITPLKSGLTRVPILYRMKAAAAISHPLKSAIGSARYSNGCPCRVVLP